LPSQKPSVLHEAEPMSEHRAWTSGEPAGTFEQVPSDSDRPHDLHVPVHAV
jgi:hypothetical protein